MKTILPVLFAFVLTGFCHAQEVPEVPGPQAEHEWLKKFEGQWQSTSTGKMAPDQPEFVCEGVIRGRMLGQLWVINEMKTEVGGTTVQGVQTIGYDPAKKKFIGTWVDSMVNHMWHYEGTLDKTGNKLILEAEGPNFMGDGKMTKYRDAYEFKSDDLMLMTSSAQANDGKWVTFMEGEAKRQPAKKE